MSTANTNDTAVYKTLRNGLIWGRWKSGEHLKPQHLRDEMNCTVSMLREALLRLAGEGLVVSEKNHGFRAVAHSKETFREAAHLRLVLECEAAEMALAAGDFDWEIAVSAAHNKLTYVEKQMLELNDVSEHLERWSRQDWEFHSTLLSACGSTLLMRSYKSAFDTFRMYAVSEIRNFGFSAEITLDEHAAIYEAAVQRDKAKCIAAIERHLTLFENRNRSSEPVPEKKRIARKKSQ